MPHLGRSDIERQQQLRREQAGRGGGSLSGGANDDNRRPMTAHHARMILDAIDDLALEVRDLRKRMEKIMPKVDDVLAAITANTDIAKSSAQAIDALREGQATIAQKIQELKDQADDVDFTAVDAALADQKTILDGANAAIGSNTVTPV